MPPSPSDFRRLCLRAAWLYDQRALAATDAAEAASWQDARAQAHAAAALCRSVENEARRRLLALLQAADLPAWADALQTGDVARCLDLPGRSRAD